MDDREMLELAAKAINLNIVRIDETRNPPRAVIVRTSTILAYWNPLGRNLADKGQLYDLMHDLKMRVDFTQQHAFWFKGIEDGIICRWPQDEPDAPHAILRVAAEIGKRMQEQVNGEM